MKPRLLLLFLMLVSLDALGATSKCRDAGDDDRKLTSVLEEQERDRHAAVFILLSDCRYQWHGEIGRYEYNEGKDTFTFRGVRLPWGDTAVLQPDTDIVFSEDSYGTTGITVLKLRRERGWSLCPLWPVCD